MKIGFFGGCFNPPTNAHIELAKKALNECKLDKIIFVPVGDFYNKKDLVSGEHRYNMLKIACKYLKNINVTDLEIKIKKEIYAIDAFKLIEDNYSGNEIYFLIGADNFKNITKWKNAEDLIQKYKYIVFERENINIEDFIAKEKINNAYVIKNESYNLCSASKFRNEFRKEKKYNKEIIQDSVLNYIIANNLYLE